MSNKRRFTAIMSQSNQSSEDGEDCSPLPYVRLSRRSNRGTSKQLTEADMLETMAIREIPPDRLLATKRIVTAFNAGDIEGIYDIVQESTLESCDVYFSNLQHVFNGKNALFSLWASLFEAFPNGIFRTSDSVINEKKQVFTSFLFFGTKIFPLLIDGMPVEILANANIATNNTLNSLPTSLNPKGSVTTTLTAQHIISGSGSIPIPSNTSSTNTESAVSVKVDRARPMFTTAELLEVEQIPEMVFEGRIVLHMNEQCKIRKFDFAWNRKF